MGKQQRDKGNRGERELMALISEELGGTYRRSMESERSGGADCLEVPGWAIEVKRTETFLSAFWEQACEQAEKARRRPALFWRKNRHGWVAHVDLHDLNPSAYPNRGEYCRMSLNSWCQLVRELWAQEQS